MHSIEHLKFFHVYDGLERKKGEKMKKTSGKDALIDKICIYLDRE